ncbi:ATP-dependent DNA helicase RecG [Paenibacillus filicis]|uniref:ATP-dependent DNA helicase RecG n=1 Tax=Paenibacillus gyeongsangnamensis TaxID=3388067 RepID=A0ABT4Q3P3_9BACL|nr:ATP-dependent DNA helicase RecG [Paenibacillus filicis]MCZ8511438.1 ATP-dependent DNA helicase RecG [Paenibacillus filicis]
MAIDLYALPVTQVSGVKGKKPEELLALGITSVGQLLDYYPFRYEDYTLRDLTQVKDGDKITVQGTIAGVPQVQMYGRTKSRMTCKIVVDSLFITAVWFNRHFLRDKLTAGAEIVLTGKWDQKRLHLTISETEFPGQGKSQTGTLQPVYSITGALTQKWMRQTMKQALLQFGELIPEVLPAELLTRYDLLPRKKAMALLHAPGSLEQGQQARRRMVYEELFLFQLKMQAYRALNHDRADGVAHPVDLPAVRAFVRALPFTLTASQKQVLAEILHDLQQPHCMNRLLQGDVGAGKTVVAASALFAVVKSGYQGALMVPTEILAEQHKRSLDRLFEPYGIQTALLTGSLTDRQRRDLLASLQMGLIDVVVGTHALIQEDVYFRQLGLVVTDEQHRFGVNQRSILRRKGMNPDVLTMTATPIPRTLAITAFGDMDVSTLRELPKGRKPIQTYAVTPAMLERVLGFIRREVSAGRQAYVICPLIEESEKLDVQNAIDVHAQLQFAFPEYRVGLLHGRMTASEKDEIMRQFSSNEVQVLVSTTVIEVGVDVPNSTLMVVYDADRFGLSQLHQLRGRVGRGEHQSYCILIADPKNEVGKERMKAMTDTNDGFEIARRDLELRGPGDFFGTKQSGLPEFRVADMVTDFETMEQARDDAAELVRRPDFWTGASYASLRQFLQRENIFTGDLLD